MPHAQHDDNVHYYSMTAIRRSVRAMMVIVAVSILIAPAFALYFVHSMVIRLALIAVFSLLFALALSLGTQPKP
jgi:hypothetical protein